MLDRATLPLVLGLCVGAAACTVVPSQFPTVSAPAASELESPPSAASAETPTAQSLPVERRRLLDFVSQFLDRIERGQTIDATQFTPAARLVAREGGRVRQLYSSLLEYAGREGLADGAANSNTSGHRFRIWDASSVRAERRIASDSVLPVVEVSVPCARTTASVRAAEPSWLVVVAPTADGLRIAELQTDDGTLR